MTALIWIVFGMLALFWTALAYVATALLAWTAQLVGGGAGAAELADLVSHWSLPSWLLIWVDAQKIQAAQVALVAFLERFQGAWPGLGQAMAGLEPLVWGVWAVGLLPLLGLAALGHWLVHRQAKQKLPAAIPPGQA